MIPSRLLLVLLLATLAGCTTQQKAHLETFNVGAYEKNWDEIDIVGVDQRRIAPRRDIQLWPGRRTVTFRVNYMRGDMKKPIFADVPVTADFVAARRYRANIHYKDAGMMGVFISELDTPMDDYNLRAGALVWSSEYAKYQQKKK